MEMCVTWAEKKLVRSRRHYGTNSAKITPLKKNSEWHAPTKEQKNT